MLDSVSLDKANGRAPYWCSSQNITLAQIRRIIIDKLDTQREQWKQPFIVLATKALQEKFPCPAPSRDSRENRPSEPSLEGNSTQIEFPEISTSTILKMLSQNRWCRGDAGADGHSRRKRQSGLAPRGYRSEGRSRRPERALLDGIAS